MARSQAIGIPTHTFTLKVSQARTRCMNCEMKKPRKELPHGRARHVAVPLCKTTTTDRGPGRWQIRKCARSFVRAEPVSTSD